MTAYYNDHDKFVCAWLHELMIDGLIPKGEIDNRSILDVKAAHLAEFDQCHFFAGIAGWAYALRLARWPDGRPVWTGSCPCQPLSVAGKQQGHADERHLWPAFHALISECRPSTVFGEQVASKDGREWLAGVRADLEDDGYACGAADLCSAGVRAPHIRQRLFWVAYAAKGRQRVDGRASRGAGHTDQRVEAQFVADPDGRDASTEGLQRSGQHGQQPQDGIAGCKLGDAESDNRRGELEARGTGGRRPRSAGTSPHGVALGNTNGAGLGEQCRPEPVQSKLAALEHRGRSILLPCADGRFRRVPADEAGELESSLFPLAHGFSNRVGILRGAGNAIDPILASEFIEATVLSLTDI